MGSMPCNHRKDNEHGRDVVQEIRCQNFYFLVLIKQQHGNKNKLGVVGLSSNERSIRVKKMQIHHFHTFGRKPRHAVRGDTPKQTNQEQADHCFPVSRFVDGWKCLSHLQTPRRQTIVRWSFSIGVNVVADSTRAIKFSKGSCRMHRIVSWRMDGLWNMWACLPKTGTCPHVLSLRCGWKYWCMLLELYASIQNLPDRFSAHVRRITRRPGAFRKLAVSTSDQRRNRLKNPPVMEEFLEWSWPKKCSNINKRSVEDVFMSMAPGARAL